MKKRFQAIMSLFLGVILFSIQSTSFAGSAPVAMLMQVEGTVEYSKDGKKWKKVRRNKLLKDGYYVRSGNDGSANIVMQNDGSMRKLGANSSAKIKESGTEKVSGSLSEASKGGTSLLAGVGNRFSSAQRYTTVRRSVTKPKPLKLKTVKEISLSDNYPDLVWENMGKEYSYNFILDGKSSKISASEDKMIRHKLSGLSEGIHKVKVEVVKDDKVVYTPRRGSLVHWLSDVEMEKVKEGLAEVGKVAPDNDFFVAYYLNEQGLTVAAMDAYRSYLDANKDDNDVRPMLIEVYHQLKLKRLKKDEALVYNNLEQADS